MLEYDHNKRITAEKALSHKYFALNENEIHEPTIQKRIERLNNFKVSKYLNYFIISVIQVQSNLLQGILSYFYTFIDFIESEKEIKKIFLKFDKNHDGSLSKEEIFSGY